MVGTWGVLPVCSSVLEDARSVIEDTSDGLTVGDYPDDENGARQKYSSVSVLTRGGLFESLINTKHLPRRLFPAVSR